MNESNKGSLGTQILTLNQALLRVIGQKSDVIEATISRSNYSEHCLGSMASMPMSEQFPTIETPTLLNRSNTQSQKAGYTLSLALLSSSACTQASDIQVRINNPKR